MVDTFEESELSATLGSSDLEGFLDNTILGVGISLHSYLDGTLLDYNNLVGYLAMEKNGTTNIYNTNITYATTINANVVIPDVPCDPTVYVGACVRMMVDGTCVNAFGDDYANSNVIGICESKETSIKCTIRVTGVTPDIYTGLDVAKEYYLSDVIAGDLLPTFPTITGHVKIKIGQPFSATRLLVLKSDRVVRG